jgi:hypothetical protein
MLPRPVFRHETTGALTCTEITPWFHLTGDMQVIQNSNAVTDTSLVLGMRAIIDL